MSFRINSKLFFLTYARCDAEKSDLMDMLKVKCPNYQYILISRESHEDGALHLHAFIQLKTRKDVINPRFFDLRDFHPKVESAKDIQGSIDYVKKDGDILEIGSPIIPSKKKQKITNKEYLEMDLKLAVDEDKISLFSLPGILNARKAYADLCESSMPDIGLGAFISIWKDLDLEILPITTKRRHFWIYSNCPNKGKTTFLEKVASNYRSSYYSQTEKYQVITPKSQFVLFDEFAKGNSVRITELNMMCDGNYKYPRKGQPPVVLNKPYIIICSNFPISEVYPNSNGRVEARFNEYCLDYYEFI